MLLSSRYRLALKRFHAHSRISSEHKRLRLNQAQQIRLQHSAVTEVATSNFPLTHDGGRFNRKPQLGTGLNMTAKSKSHIKRNSRFNKLDVGDVEFFTRTLGPGAVIDGVTKDASEELSSFSIDWTRRYRGEARLVLKPESTKQVSEILQYCNKRMLAITPQGGNTGLVGGSVPVFDEVVVHLGRMNKIRSFEGTSGVLVADAGVLLQEADETAKSHDCIFPLALGAKGSCQIGGNISTNAGGLRLLHYGSLHGNVLGLEVVFPDGSIMDDLSLLRKNNTGYDLKQLFIGAEGTIGIVTAVSILCPQRPLATNVAYFGLQSYEKVLQSFRKAKKGLSEILSAFELMDAPAQKLYHRATGRKLPLEKQYPFYCLIETSGSNLGHDNEKLNTFLEEVMQDSIVADGTLAQDETQAQALWACREGISEASQHFGGVYKYDLSLPLLDLYGLIKQTRNRLQDCGVLGDTEDYPVIDIVGYGHMGDSNLHMNIVTRRYDKIVEDVLEPYIYEWVARHQGSISAEHGLGLAKKEFIGYSRSDAMIRLMKQIKTLYDPNGIMNPYKYL